MRYSDTRHTSFGTEAISAISTNVALVSGIAPLTPFSSVGRIPEECETPARRGFPRGRKSLEMRKIGLRR